MNHSLESPQSFDSESKKNLLHSQASSRPCMYQIHRVFHLLLWVVDEKRIWIKNRNISNNSVAVLKEYMYGCNCSTTTVVDWRQNVCKENRNERRNWISWGWSLGKENIFYFCFQDSTKDKQIEFIGLQCLVVDITTRKTKMKKFSSKDIFF